MVFVQSVSMSSFNPFASILVRRRFINRRYSKENDRGRVNHDDAIIAVVLSHPFFSNSRTTFYAQCPLTQEFPICTHVSSSALIFFNGFLRCAETYFRFFLYPCIRIQRLNSGLSYQPISSRVL